ncbi:C10 family peptidase [Olleya sp. YSTF-M6]|uniref:C10 family peptidase n=1 Tax=Olleya sediminilitoris TaxID=2795739 RepID=A0ABS1WM18_9FLAO|nr:C10 family peptidase [Olleya sediminilitoris]MBL7560167.1 C10 family peptidase [Olleya sediminilitoris]
MKTKIFNVFIFCFLGTHLISAQSENSDFISFEVANKVAEIWMNAKGYEKTVDQSASFTNVEIEIGKSLSLYVLNFKEGGFAIVPATKKVIPVLAYNDKLLFNSDRRIEGAQHFLKAYNEAITIHLDTDTAMELANEQWETLLTTYSIADCTGQSTLYPSLLEQYGTSRWAGWTNIYDCVTPLSPLAPNALDFNDGIGGTCVPTALSQICAFFRHPFVGVGTGSHTMAIGSAVGQTVSSDFSSQAFDYNLMPYALQRQGPADGYGNSSSNDWLHFTEECSNERNEVGFLTFNLGVAARMNWYSGGTFGSTANWAQDLVDHFDYVWNPSTDFVTTSSPALFKSRLRNSLDNERPVLAAGFNNGGGHCFLYTGYECDNYFYASLGFGGNSDGFYYIFTTDANGNYQNTSYTNSQNCATNIRPNCDLPSYYQVPAITYANNTVVVEQALIDLTVSDIGTSVQLDSGSEVFFIGGNSVTLNAGTNVDLGAQLHVNIEDCNGPN